MEIITEEILIYGFIIQLIIGVVLIYIRKQKLKSKDVSEKIIQAKADGMHEPVSVYPVVDLDRCINSGACVIACPEEDVLGIENGKAVVINAARCIGHGACFRACPVEAISLLIGTEKRGVDIPHINNNFETNVPGVYIAGELGGMGLIKTAVNQGREAVEYIAKTIKKESTADYDLIVVGAGPAGISATLAAKKAKLKVLTLEQDTLGGTVLTFHRSKVILTSPMELPLYGKVKFKETTKTELLDLWKTVIEKNGIIIKENSKVETINPEGDIFILKTSHGDSFSTKTVLIAIGRRGTPRKLKVPGENSEKVAYRLLDDEDEIKDKDILVVGGGDSAIEAALLLSEKNRVILSYRRSAFNRLKQKNATKIALAIENKKVIVKFNSQVVSIDPNFVMYTENDSAEVLKIKNDKVFVCAGGELPTQFLKNIGIHLSIKHGEVVMKHSKTRF